MAIDFPASPINGQVYQGYYYDSSKSAWRSETPSVGAVVTSTTTPTGAKNGDLWYNTNDGTLYVYFDNGITAYWTEVKANSALTTTLNATKANLAGGNAFSGTQTVSGTVDATAFKTSNISIIPKFLQVVNLGALQTNYSFTLSEKSICQFNFSATGYYGSTGIRTWNLVVNSTTISSTKHFFNVTSTHLSTLVGVGSITLPAGTYNAQVTTDASYDSNDFCSIWATAIPSA